jgi:hypothetical protein
VLWKSLLFSYVEVVVEVAREVPTVEVPTVEVAVDDVEEVPMQIKHQLKLAGKLSAGTSVWNFK